MPENVLYCECCKTKVAILTKGSKVKIGMVALCAPCEKKRKAMEFESKLGGNKKKSPYGDLFDDIFGGR